MHATKLFGSYLLRIAKSPFFWPPTVVAGIHDVYVKFINPLVPSRFRWKNYNMGEYTFFPWILCLTILVSGFLAFLEISSRTSDEETLRKRFEHRKKLNDQFGEFIQSWPDRYEGIYNHIVLVDARYPDAHRSSYDDELEHHGRYEFRGIHAESAIDVFVGSNNLVFVEPLGWCKPKNATAEEGPQFCLLAGRLPFDSVVDVSFSGHVPVVWCNFFSKKRAFPKYVWFRKLETPNHIEWYEVAEDETVRRNSKKYGSMKSKLFFWR
jgi:hypothetical protein